MKQFFSDNKITSLSILEENKLNGKASERYIASLLTIALNARVSFTSRTDDDAKIDLITLFSHPWLKNIVLPIATQVKSGKSFGTIKEDKLSLTKSKFSELLNKSDWFLVCWTKTEGDEAYWFLIKPQAKFIKLDYNSNHLINPLTKFHLIRIINSLTTKNGGKGLVFPRKNKNQDYENSEYKSLRLSAKNKYSIMKKSIVINPVFGEIDFTRIGWRHITRESRWNYFKTASFEVLKIIDKILNVAPNKHYTVKHISKEENDSVFVENEYLLNYANVKVYDSKTKKTYSVEVFVKLLEISGYKKDWKKNPSNSNFSFRRMIFKSIYYKQNSQNMHAQSVSQ